MHAVICKLIFVNFIALLLGKKNENGEVRFFKNHS